MSTFFVIPATCGERSRTKARIHYHLGEDLLAVSPNKSFPRCVSSLENRFTLFDCSLGKHTSRSKNKRWLWTTIFAGVKIYYRSEQLQQAETLVTVSPCEFPPRCFPRILPCHPRLGRGSPLFPHISQLRHLAFPNFLYRLQTNDLLEKKDWT